MWRGPPAAPLALLLCTPLTGAPAQEAWSVVDVAAESEAQMRALVEAGLDECDIWSLDEREARVLVTAQQRAWLQSQGLTVTVLHELEAIPKPVDGYKTLAEIEADMRAWASTHPEIVSLTSIGKSWQGRDLWLVKISDNVEVDEDEPEALMIGLQHAREWLAGMTSHGVVEQLIAGYGNDPDATDLVDTMEIFAILVLNPDGYVHTHMTDRFWRKNRRDNGDGTFGVDLNRNFAWKWETASANTSSHTYRGPAPLSEPETQALATWVESRGPSLVGALNIHSYGALVIHAWAYSFDHPPNAAAVGPMARDMALAMEAINGQRYQNGQWSILLGYLGGGTTRDHMNAIWGIPSVGIEVPPSGDQGGGFDPPGTLIAPTVAENIEGARVYLHWVRDHATDTTAPVISDLAVTRISDTQATVTWITDDLTTPLVEYGTTQAYGTRDEPFRLRGTHHSNTLTGLTPSTLYHVRVRAENTAGLLTLSEDITFSTAATPQDITPPASPVLLSARRAGPGEVELQWSNHLETGPILGNRLWESVDGETWSLVLDENDLATGTSGEHSVTLTRLSDWEPRIYRVTMVDRAPHRNESDPSDAYAVSVGSEATEILIVDGYDRWNSKPISGGLNHAFAADHGLAVGTSGLAFDTCANQEAGVTVSLPDYEAVIWALGDESTAQETLDTAEQALVTTYLAGGGSLFISGSELARDLDSRGSDADRSFIRSILFAEFADDDTNDYDVTGTGDGSLFTTRLIRFDEGSRGIYRVGSPDSITPLGDAVAALQTPDGEVVALQRRGAFGSGTSPGRLVLLAFPFETIFPAESRGAVMRDVLDFFGLTAPPGPAGLLHR